jgi:hypothetical protein
MALGLTAALAPYEGLANPPSSAPWTLPPPPNAPQAPTNTPVASTAPATLAVRPYRRPSATLGVMGALAIPTNGPTSELLNVGGAGLIFGTQEFARRFSARLEVGLRKHGAASDGSLPGSVLSMNTGLRFYLLYEGTVRPYLGAHIVSAIALGAGSTAGFGLGVGASGGANFAISELFEVGAELRYESVFAFSIDPARASALDGGLLSVMGSFSFVVY